LIVWALAQSRGDENRSLVTPERVLSEYNEDLIFFDIHNSQRHSLILTPKMEKDIGSGLSTASKGPSFIFFCKNKSPTLKCGSSLQWLYSALLKVQSPCDVRPFYHRWL